MALILNVLLIILPIWIGLSLVTGGSLFWGTCCMVMSGVQIGLVLCRGRLIRYRRMLDNEYYTQKRTMETYFDDMVEREVKRRVAEKIGKGDDDGKSNVFSLAAKRRE